MITIGESTTTMEKPTFTPGTPGDRLMAVISELGFTNQGDFAEKLYEPISQPTVSRWVNRRDPFSRTIMFALSGYLIERGINPDWLNDPTQPKYIRDMVDDGPVSRKMPSSVSDLQMDIIRLKQQREADIERLRDKFDEERRELQEKIHQMQAEIIQAYKEIAKYSKLLLDQQQGRDLPDDDLE